MRVFDSLDGVREELDEIVNKLNNQIVRKQDLIDKKPAGIQVQKQQLNYLYGGRFAYMDARSMLDQINPELIAELERRRQLPVNIPAMPEDSLPRGDAYWESIAPEVENA